MSKSVRCVSVPDVIANMIMKTQLILLFWVLFWACPGSAEPIFAKIATTLPADHPTVEALRFFKKDIAEASNGQMAIRIFSDTELGSPSQLLNGLQFGNIEMGVLSSEMLAASFPTLQTILMPYIFRDPVHKYRVLDGPIGKALLQQLEQANLIGIGFLATDPRNFLLKSKAVTQPEDFAGREIGVPRACPLAECHDITLNLMQDTLSALGATPRIIEMDAMTPFLQQKTSDGIELSLTRMPQLPLKEIGATQVLVDAHAAIPDIFIISQRWFEKLQPEQQQQFRRSANKMIQFQRDIVDERNQQIALGFENGGVMLHFIEQEAFFQAVQSVYKKKAQEFGLSFEDILRSIYEVH